MTKQRHRYSNGFKLEVIALVTDYGYSLRQAADAMSVGKSTLEKDILKQASVLLGAGNLKKY